MRERFSFFVLALFIALTVGCDAGCATSKPFAAGVSTGVPLMKRDLLHFAGTDPLRKADVEALLAATRDESSIDVDSTERSWNAVKTWYLPAVDLMPDRGDG